MAAVKGVRTIAEYKIWKWLQENHFDMECFEVSISGNEAFITDAQGDKLKLVYDGRQVTVHET